MARPKRCRRIQFRPPVLRYEPAGGDGAASGEVLLSLDEFEAMRLADLEGLYQDEAAERMNVSRPTFARIVADARRKVMVALAGGQTLRIEPGAAPPAEGARHSCSVCGHDWHGAARKAESCPACGSAKVVKVCGAVCPIADCSCPLRRAAVPPPPAQPPSPRRSGRS